MNQTENVDINDMIEYSDSTILTYVKATQMIELTKKIDLETGEEQPSIEANSIGYTLNFNTNLDLYLNDGYEYITFEDNKIILSKSKLIKGTFKISRKKTGGSLKSNQVRQILDIISGNDKDSFILTPSDDNIPNSHILHFTFEKSKDLVFTTQVRFTVSASVLGDRIHIVAQDRGTARLQQPELQRYRNRITYYTERTLSDRNNLAKINNWQKYRTDGHSVDHMLSVNDGLKGDSKNSYHPSILSTIHNLRIVTVSENSSKKDTSIHTYDELCMKIVADIGFIGLARLLELPR